MRHVWLTAVFLGLVTAPAYAYIDPVTGSVLIQGLIGGAAAILASIRSVREKVLGLFSRGKPAQLGADADVKN